MTLISGLKQVLNVAAFSIMSFCALAATENQKVAGQQAENLSILTDSEDAFAGVYLADRHSIHFDAYVGGEGNVHFKFDIDGNFRELSFDIERTELFLTSGEIQVTENERTLMYDAARSVVDYVQTREEEGLNDHVVVLVGALSSWDQVALKH